MRKKTMAVALALVMLAASVLPAFAITWGAPDGNAHPYVGTLLFQTASGFYSCSGTLLSPTVMLTAGHCTEEAGETNIATWVNFSEEISFADREPGEPLVDYLNDHWIQTSSVHPHPGYDDFATFPNTFDVGVVILAEAVDLPTYGQLPPIGLLDSISSTKGKKSKSFTAVGYGMQGFIQPFAMDDWARYAGTVMLVEVNSNFNGSQHSAKFSNNPGGGNGSGGTCFGDSGGPVFYGNSNVVGAVVSWGITPCIGVDYQFRVDTPLAQNFVRSFLP